MTAKYLNSARMIARVTLLVFVIVSIGGCGSDGGTKPARFGAIEGVVRLPFKLAASGEPVAGASVRLQAGDFDTVTVTDATGAFFLDQVPALQVSLSANLDPCLAVSRYVTVRANDTISVDISLESHADFDTISVGWRGALRMEIDPATNRAVLLFGAASRGGTPGIVTVDLTTGQFTSADLPDLTDVFDLEIINSNEVVFNFKSAAGYGLRFFNPVAMTTIGEDAIYPSAQSGQADYEGRIALDDDKQNVFVTHVIRQIDTKATIGKVYAVAVTQQQLIDADNELRNGEFAFDTNLVANSVVWTYNIAFDEATNEILVGNRTTPTIIAIDWAMWGQFDRDAGLSAPTTGVRIIDMEPPSNEDKGFGVDTWGFAAGNGIAIKDLSGRTPILHYESGHDTWSHSSVETSIKPATTNNVVKIIPQRQSWFTAFRDQSRELTGVISAIEERPFDSLERLYRYESRFIEEPSPTAFAIDAEHNLLYVAYSQNAFLEVFCLP